MSLTALLFVLLYFGGLIATFIHPVFGILIYIFEWHNSPNYVWWGRELPDLRWSLLISVATLVSAILRYNKLKKLPQFSFGPGILLIVFSIWMFIVSNGWAVWPEESHRKSIEFIKFVIFYFLIIFVVRERKHFDWIMWMMIACVANFGRMAWEGGSHRFVGFKAPNATNSNTIAGYTVSAMPFFGAKFVELKKWNWKRIFIGLSVPFVINLMILVNSRGAFVAFLMVGVVAFILSSLKDKMKIIGLLIAGAVLLFYLGNEQFWERQQTIDTNPQEASAASRFILWKAAIDMANDYPFGVGGEAPEKLTYTYAPGQGGKTIHSSYFLVLAEWGYLGFVLLIAFLLYTFFILSNLKRLLKIYPALHDNFYYKILTVQLALTGFLTASIFTNNFYADALYWYTAFAVALKNIVYDEIHSLYHSETKTEVEYTSV